MHKDSNRLFLIKSCFEKHNTIKAKDTKRVTEFFSRRFGVFMMPFMSSEMIIQVDNLQNQSELT